MTYSSGQTIDDADYNNFVYGDSTGSGTINVSNNLYYLIGPGRADRGLNQDFTGLVPGLPGSLSGTIGGVPYNDRVGTLTSVEAPDDILAQQWIGFFSSLNRTRFYQSGAGSNVSLATPPAFGSRIDVIASINSVLNSANLWFTSPSPVQGVDDATNDNKSVALIVATTADPISRTYTRTVEFSNGGDHARWFFNSGGQIRVSVTATRAVGSRSQALATTLQQFGTCTWGAYTNSGFSTNDTPSPSGANKGYWNTGTTYLTLGTNSLGAGAYSTTVVGMEVRVPTDGGGATQNGAVGRKIEFRLSLTSSSGGTGPEPAWATDSLDIDIAFNFDIVNKTGSGSTLTRTWQIPQMSGIT
jgi:hypothetical protein